MSRVAVMTLVLQAPPALAQWISPGPLAEGHAKLDDINTCEKCHAPGKRVEAARCLACHDEVALPLKAGKGYHARLLRESGKGCEGCHSDHRGRGYPLIRWSPPAGFDHAKEIGFALTGAHGRIACEACHEHRPRYIGARTTCAGCHEDPHGGELGKSCEGCHDTSAFSPAPRFDHAKSGFPLENRHAGVTCTSCHKPSGKGVQRYAIKDSERCSTCHGDPHGGRTALSPCTDCHTTAGWTQVKSLPPAHSPAGWPLVGKHAAVACADCHGPSLTAKVQTSCASCHADTHKGRFGGKCESCHDEGGWKKVRPGGFDHSRTRYPLEGRHEQVRCDKCHRPAGGKLSYRGLAFDRCEACHKPWHAESLAGGTECETCHTVEGFTPSTFTSVEHAAARFHLDGSHLAAPCEGCHTKKPKKPTTLAVGMKRCDECHADPHAGQFKAKMAGGKSCTACHTTAGWAKDAFDHEATHFPLRGVHASAACESCHRRARVRASRSGPKAERQAEPREDRDILHEPERADRDDDPVKYKGLATSCEGCHRDPHAGQLATRGCVACHHQSSWAIAPFDHGALTSFPLDGRHAPLACEACHDTRTLSDGTSLTHYDLGYRACADCHANPHARKGDARAGEAACETCHRPAGWKALPDKVAFNHAATGFPLDGRHASVGCNACHGSSLETSRTRSTCESCHEDEHRGELGKHCESCHDARGWDPSDPLMRHRATGFPLVGAHAAADCTACHDTTREARWSRPSADCYGCHARDYQRSDLHPNHLVANFSKACETCHAQDSFSPARVRHQVFWPLRGAHASAECVECHAGERYGGTARACVDCHRDEYLAAADPPHQSFGISERCQGCHTEIAWSSVVPTWHDPFFPIASGDHANIACADCHFAGTLPPANYSCTGCHSREETDHHHGEVSAYAWESFACYACHPRGEE